MLPQHHRTWNKGTRAGGRCGGSHQAHPRRVVCKAFGRGVTDADCAHLEAAAKLSESAAGETQPHPNAACILVGPDGRQITSAYQRAHGTVSAEVLAVSAAGPAARGSTAYLNLESGDCHGEAAAVDALVRGGVERVVVGIRHPLRHLRSRGIGMLRNAGVRVDVLADQLAIGRTGTPSAVAAALSSGSGDDGAGPNGGSMYGNGGSSAAYQALGACLTANDALLHRAVLRRPLSVLKYAMTLDGKIATNMGHSAWVSSPQSRALVFETRARSDAVIVGGNTVRRDNPRLTTRREGGHTPVRMVMSRTLDLPEDANLWDVTLAPTIVLTQRGARQRFQSALRAAGVEVVEFDFLTPESVADYCQERGFLQCFWECGGTLAAPAIASGVVHKVMAFVAPKIIGGLRAPTPVGELGFVEMTQAVELVDTTWEQVGPDLMITGHMPSSGGVWALEATLETGDDESAASAASEPSVHLPSSSPSSSPSSPSSSPASKGPSGSGGGASGGKKLGESEEGRGKAVSLAAKRRRGLGGPHSRSVSFYKAWDQWGALSNFSPHPITMPVEASAGSSSSSNGASSNGNGASACCHQTRVWSSVEHYYQAHKFSGGHHPDAAAVVEAIAAAPSPEEAARIGRRTERTRPELLRRDWADSKVPIMLQALRAKFKQHAGPRAMLLATAGLHVDGSGSLAAAAAPALAGVAAVGATATVGSSNNGTVLVAAAPAGGSGGAGSAGARDCGVGADAGVVCYELVEASPNDYFWGAGYERTGQNKLGQLLMQVRDELLQEISTSACESTWQVDGALQGSAAASAAAPASRG